MMTCDVKSSINLLPSSDTYYTIPEENHISYKNNMTMNMRKLGLLNY